MSNHTDVLIVGAGPTGLTLALDLARRGAGFRIVDKAPEEFRGSRGKGLQPRTLEIFDDLGVIDDILATGEVYPPMRVRVGRIPLFQSRMHKRKDPTPAVPYPMVTMQPQWRTEKILRDRLAEFGGKVEQGAELISFEQDGHGVTATLGTGETIRARYLVGTDGGRSLVRKTLGIGFEGTTRKEERILIGDVRVTGIGRDHIHAWFRPGRGLVVLFPMAGTDTFQFVAPLPPGAGYALTLDGYRRVLAERSLLGSVEVTELLWSSLYQVNIRMADRYRAGRVLLAGDAAHVHSPAGGQGLNTGVQDAYNLGWKLARVLDGAPESLLDTYEEERKPVAAHVLGLSTMLHDKRSHKRDEETQQLLLGYRGGSLASGERAGDRAPDARCHLADGTPVRLFDLFRGPHFTVLTSGPVPRFDGVRSHEIGDWERIRDAYGDERHVLVRPDGYIALTTSSADELAAYLARV
ncbi:FAD-dependent oxidoreductase [Sphaerisporangium perillae]|uniref:FAD-dependent oxidoreductase n=1 Tax=Sphaerisporangium perillae TaxID=2935860 RepID=UPI00200C8740|nr:FAD-dependent oxidoreductase [Sphaerisporangium perillae]